MTQSNVILRRYLNLTSYYSPYVSSKENLGMIFNEPVEDLSRYGCNMMFDYLNSFFDERTGGTIAEVRSKTGMTLNDESRRWAWSAQKLASLVGSLYDMNYRPWDPQEGALSIYFLGTILDSEENIHYFLFHRYGYGWEACEITKREYLFFDLRDWANKDRGGAELDLFELCMDEGRIS